MRKLKTPDWVLNGGKKPEKKAKEKTFKIRRCPKCRSNKVNVVLTGGLESEIPSDSSEESQVKEGKSAGEWECKKCKWKGKNIDEEELNEEEFMKYLDENGEEVA